MTQRRWWSSIGAMSMVLGILTLASVGACGSVNDANQRGVGAQCASNADCSEANQTCLAFKGGYCGVRGCMQDSSCPPGSACIAHTDGMKYCFLVCDTKANCNANRTPDVEANCSSSVTFVEGAKGRKACVPP